MDESAEAIELYSISYFEFYNSLIYAGFADVSGNKILAMIEVGETEQTTYFKVLEMNGASANYLSAVTSGWDGTLMATSYHELNESFFGALTLLDTKGLHVWTYTQNFGIDNYFEWKNLEYRGLENKGCICSQKSNGLSIIIMHFEYNISGVLQSTMFEYLSTTEK